MSSMGEAVRQLVRYDRTFEPQAARRAYYDDKVRALPSAVRRAAPHQCAIPLNHFVRQS